MVTDSLCRSNLDRLERHSSPGVVISPANRYFAGLVVIGDKRMILNLARFDFVLMRLVVDCAQSGSLSAAARSSHLALAAASRRVRELEATLGQPLFDRQPKGLSITEAGRVFVRHALTLLQTMDQLDSELGDLRLWKTRHIRLSASTAALTQFLPPLLARYTVLEPQLCIDLDEEVSDAVVLAVREGRADVGIFVEGPDTTNLNTRQFRCDELVLVMPGSHRLASGTAPVPFIETLDEDWISLVNGAALLERQQQSALSANKPLRLRVQVRTFEAVCHLVAANLGIAILPRLAVSPFLHGLGLVSRPLADHWAKRRLLIASATAQQLPEVGNLINFLADPSQNTKDPIRNGNRRAQADFSY
jgi:DNA-binding transcriptional LysR family regulator